MYHYEGVLCELEYMAGRKRQGVHGVQLTPWASFIEAHTEHSEYLTLLDPLTERTSRPQVHGGRLPARRRRALRNPLYERGGGHHYLFSPHARLYGESWEECDRAR